jgi:hypothetical protein
VDLVLRRHAFGSIYVSGAIFGEPGLRIRSTLLLLANRGVAVDIQRCPCSIPRPGNLRLPFGASGSLLGDSLRFQLRAPAGTVAEVLEGEQGGLIFDFLKREELLIF